MKNMQAPCKACPFSRNVQPGALGGSPAAMYIGQVYGPFVLPCHQACNFDDPLWKEKSIDTPQCAGAAAFRAVVGVAKDMPSQLHSLPPRDDVFAKPEEFISHHIGVSLEDAKEILDIWPPEVLTEFEMEKAGVINFTRRDT